MEFNEKIKQLRTDKGLTQEQLAKLLCVSRSAVSKWESGASYPNIDAIKDLSALFGVAIDQLLSGAEILSLAKTETKELREKTVSLLFAVFDILCIFLIFLPLYANKESNVFYSVPLFQANTIGKMIKICVLVALSLITVIGLFGTVMLLIKNQKAQKTLIILSVIIQSIAVLLFAISRQPYVAVITFLFLAIKIILVFNLLLKCSKKAEIKGE